MKRATFHEDLDRAVAFHGHLCGGQIIGTRLTRYALDYFGAYDTDARPELIAFVEADRCLADAVTSVAGLTLGKRRLKWMDYGKMAVTFFNLTTGEAIRLHTTDVRPGPEVTEDADKIAFFDAIPDSELIVAEKVLLHISAGDLPGKPLDTVVCEVCGENIHDGRQIVRDGRIHCKACAGEPVYYSKIQGAP
jgi:formylmethanofuran dehydrogenase subunit E